MRSLLITLLVATIGCGEGKQTNAADSTTVTASAPVEAVQGCSNAEAIAAVLTIPEVVKKNAELHALSNADSINFVTHVQTIDDRKYYKLFTGRYDREENFESFFTFFVDQQDCSHILAFDRASDKIIPLQDWQELESKRSQPVWQQVATRPVKLPFVFNTYYDVCVHPYDSVQCDTNYPSYPLENDPKLKALVDADADAYFVLPVGDGVPAYVIAYTQYDVNRYYLVTVAGNKLVGKLKIQEADGEKILHFEIAEGNVVALYTTKNRDEKGKLVGTYRVQADGKIVSEK